MSIKYHYEIRRKPPLKTYILTASATDHASTVKNVSKRTYCFKCNINTYIYETKRTVPLKPDGFDLFASQIQICW